MADNEILLMAHLMRRAGFGASYEELEHVLLGSGVPLFREPTRQIELELVDCRTLQHGCVFATYRVKR